MARVFKRVGDKFQWTDIPDKIEETSVSMPATPSGDTAPIPPSEHIKMGDAQKRIPGPIGGHRASETFRKLQGATASRGGESRGYAGLGQITKGKAGEVIANKSDAVFAGAFGYSEQSAAPSAVVPAKTTPEPEKQSFGSEILSVITTLARNFVSRTELQGIINTSVPSELRMVGNLAGAGTKYLQLPSGYATAVWGPGGGGVDYDHIYIGGIEYTPGANPNGYDFIQIGADGSSSWIPAMISPMPTGYEIYNVKKNHIHITGATAGNI